MKIKTAILSVEQLKADDFPPLRQALGAVPGVSTVDFSLERSVAVIDFDQEQSQLDDLMRAVLRAGYKLS